MCWFLSSKILFPKIWSEESSLSVSDFAGIFIQQRARRGTGESGSSQAESAWKYVHRLALVKLYIYIYLVLIIPLWVLEVDISIEI